MAGAVCIGGAPATLANAFVRPRVNDGERQRPLERLANGLLSWLSLLAATLFFSEGVGGGQKIVDISRAKPRPPTICDCCSPGFSISTDLAELEQMGWLVSRVGARPHFLPLLSMSA
jgi:hypothetical protein